MKAKKRVWFPPLKAVTMADRRTKRRKTRSDQRRKAIEESR